MTEKEGRVIIYDHQYLKFRFKMTVMEEKKGNQFLFGTYAGKELTIDKQDYLLMSQSDILFLTD